MPFLTSGCSFAAFSISWTNSAFMPYISTAIFTGAAWASVEVPSSRPEVSNAILVILFMVTPGYRVLLL
ncbi:hypothetical protein D3C75_1096630 [compost metagenome]